MKDIFRLLPILILAFACATTNEEMASDLGEEDQNSSQNEGEENNISNNNLVDENTNATNLSEENKLNNEPLVNELPVNEAKPEQTVSEQSLPQAELAEQKKVEEASLPAANPVIESARIEPTYEEEQPKTAAANLKAFQEHFKERLGGRFVAMARVKAKRAAVYIQPNTLSTVHEYLDAGDYVHIIELANEDFVKIGKDRFMLKKQVASKLLKE